MKKLIIVDTYPNSNSKLSILYRCLVALKKTDYKIMLVSHCPVPPTHQSLCDYYIYDADNTMLPSNMNYHRTLNTDYFDAQVHYEGHALAITRNIHNALGFANIYDFDFFYFCEFDCIFSDKGLQQLEDLRIQMQQENKKMIFFRPKDFLVDGDYVYETLLFGGDVKFFFNHFKQPITVQDWIDKNMGMMLERAYYQHFKEHESDYLLVHDHSSNYFDDSEMNIHRFGSYLADFVAINNVYDMVALLMHNMSYSKQKIKIIVNAFEEDSGKLTEILSSVFHPQQWHYLTFALNENTTIYVEVFDEEDNRLGTNRYNLSKDNFEKFVSKGLIIPKN